MSNMGEKKSHLTNASTFVMVKREGERGRDGEGERDRGREKERQKERERGVTLALKAST